MPEVPRWVRLPFLGVVLLSGVLMACATPEASSVAAKQDEPTVIPPREYPDYLADIIVDERFQLWRNKVVAAGLSPVVGYWGLSTGTVKIDPDDPRPLAIREFPLYDRTSQQIPGVASVPAGESFSFTRTLETWDRVRKGIRDKLGLRPQGNLAALRFDWDDLIVTPPNRTTPDIPIKYHLWEEPHVMRPTSMQRLEQGLPLAS